MQGPAIDCCPTQRFPERAESWNWLGESCAMPDPMPVAIARRVSPGWFTEYAWDRLVQWNGYLAKTRDVHLAMRKADAGTGAACFSDSPALNGPVPGRSYAGACL